MQLTKEQSQSFLDFYFHRYRLPWEYLKDTSERLMNIWIGKDFELEEELARKEFLHKLLGSKYNKLYKMRPYWKQTIWEKVFGDLRLNYSPKFI